MKRSIVVLFVLALSFAAWLLVPSGTSAQRRPVVRYPSLQRQLDDEYYGRRVEQTSELARLIAENQQFWMLRRDEFSDRRGLPQWLRVWWRKGHPDGTYSASDPTKGYPLVLKEILEWMITHQDLKPGPGDGKEEGEGEAQKSGGEEQSPLIKSLLSIGTNVRTSGAQAAARSESDIRINFLDPQKILVASNNITGGGQQGVYRSLDGGANWTQALLPFTSTDASHSDPTVDWTNDGRAWSSTLGIVSTTLRLRNYVSTDNGASWTFEATPSGTQTDVDKQMVWVDHSATSTFYGQMYAIWHTGNPAFMNRRTAGAGGTWLAVPIQVSGAESTGTSIGGDVKTNSTGDVFGFWPTTGNSRVIVIKSTDGGNSFGTPVQISTTFDTFDIGVPSMASRNALVYVSGGAYRTMSKNLVYTAWTDLSGNAGCTAPANEPNTNAASTCKTRIWFSRSTDGGATWSPKAKINDQASLNDQFNQAMAVDETTGSLGIIYYDTVADAGRLKTDVWFQSSVDDGVTWSPAEKVTTAMTDETVAAADLGNQYGDYNSLTGYANNFFPSWTDRRSAAREEIWTAPITLGPPAANIASTSVSITSGNNLIEPSECNTVNIPVTNGGNLSATGVSAVLSTSTAGVTVTQPNSAYPDIASGGTQTNTTPFQVSTDNTVACFSSVNLTLTVTYTGGASSPKVFNYTVPVGQAAAPNYTFTSTSGNTISGTGTLVPGSAADDVTVTTTTPFAFTLYGSPVTSGQTIVLSTNGTLQIAATGTNAYANIALPVSSSSGVGVTGTFPAATASLFPYWDDLDMSAVTNGGGIYTETTGAVGSRTFKVEWRARHFVNGQAAAAPDTDFAVYFHENSENFEYVYTLTGAGANAAGASSTVGVQAASSGTQFTQFSFNSATLSAGLKLSAARTAASCTAGGGGCAAASNASVTGQVFDPAMAGLRNVVVTIVNTRTNAVQTTSTNIFGGYTFASVPTGDTYLISATIKRYHFDVQSMPINGNLTNINFIGQE